MKQVYLPKRNEMNKEVLEGWKNLFKLNPNQGGIGSFGDLMYDRYLHVIQINTNNELILQLITATTCWRISGRCVSQAVLWINDVKIVQNVMQIRNSATTTPPSMNATIGLLERSTICTDF